MPIPCITHFVTGINLYWFLKLMDWLLFGQFHIQFTSFYSLDYPVTREAGLEYSTQYTIQYYWSFRDWWPTLHSTSTVMTSHWPLPSPSLNCDAHHAHCVLSTQLSPTNILLPIFLQFACLHYWLSTSYQHRYLLCFRIELAVATYVTKIWIWNWHDKPHARTLHTTLLIITHWFCHPANERTAEIGININNYAAKRSHICMIGWLVENEKDEDVKMQYC